MVFQAKLATFSVFNTESRQQLPKWLMSSSRALHLAYRVYLNPGSEELQIASDFKTYRRPSMEFLTLRRIQISDSDLHRAYPTQLCYAFRFSQPFDALFRPLPFRSYFIPVTPLGFSFQRFPLFGSQSLPFGTILSLMLFPYCSEEQQPQLQGLMHPKSPFCVGQCYPTSPNRASLSRLPLRGLLPDGLGLVLPQGLLSWASTRRATTSRCRRVCSTKYQRTAG